jgi:hypothetical protein
VRGFGPGPSERSHQTVDKTKISQEDIQTATDIGRMVALDVMRAMQMIADDARPEADEGRPFLYSVDWMIEDGDCVPVVEGFIPIDTVRCEGRGDETRIRSIRNRQLILDRIHASSAEPTDAEIGWHFRVGHEWDYSREDGGFPDGAVIAFVGDGDYGDHEVTS